MENEEKELVEESVPEETSIEAGSAEENGNPVKPKRTKKEIRTLIIVSSVYAALAILTATVLIIGFSGSSSSTIPSTHLTTASAGYYKEDKTLLSSFSTDDVSLSSKNGFYSLSSIKSKEGATYVVLPTTYNNTRITYTDDLEAGTNIFGNDEYSDAIKEIYFPKLFWTIGENSFSGMDSLTYVSFAGATEGNLDISSGAFKDCISLSSVVFPKNLRNIGEAAFENCSYPMTVEYGGTKSAFNSLGINENAFSGTVTINCTDGQITK